MDRYTAFSELLPLLAVGTNPFLKVSSISQSVDSSNLSIVNSTTLSGPFAILSFSASATFEVRSPSRIQVLLKKKKLETRWLYVKKEKRYSDRSNLQTRLNDCFVTYFVLVGALSPM